MNFYILILSIFLSTSLCAKDWGIPPKSLLYHLIKDDEPSAEVLRENHKGWTELLIAYLQGELAKDIDKCEDATEILEHFDQRDACEILKPLLLQTAQFELTDEIITAFFNEKIGFYRDCHRNSSIKAYIQPDILEEVFQTAQKVHTSINGKTLIILGQTPAYLGEMVREIDQAAEWNTPIFNVPFSGRPNYLCERTFMNRWSMIYLDIVTPTGEACYRNLLEKQGLSPRTLYERDLCIIDNSTGRSISCFVAFLHKWFHETGYPLPDCYFLEMCDADDLLTRSSSGEWEKMKNPDFRFSESHNYEMPVIFLGMKKEVIILFDKLYDNLRVVPSFNGLHWSKSYLDNELEKYPSLEAQTVLAIYRNYAHAKIN